jgi:hypothetical protein
LTVPINERSLTSLTDSILTVSGNGEGVMGTPAVERVRKHREIRKARGEQRISAYVDAESFAILDAFARRHGLTREQAVSLALRQLDNNLFGEATAA